MGLQIRQLEFKNFRSYTSLKLSNLGPRTIFIGPNAIGKTNIIEGIQLLCSQTSFRHASVDQLIHERDSFAYLNGWLSDGSRELELSLQLSQGKRRRLLNGKTRRASDIRSILPVVLFTPDDLDLTRGSSSVKRDALDTLGSQLSVNHQQIRSDYEHILQSKNRLLKEEAAPDFISSVNEIMVMVGAQLSCYRAALFSRLSQKISQFYRDISGKTELLEVSYYPSWIEYNSTIPYLLVPTRDEARQALEEALVKHRSEEEIRHKAVVGPHADHLDFFIEGKNVAQFASQGQKRSLVLAFKLAETSLIEEILDQKPVLLLDDVMGELDEIRRNALLSFLVDDLQTFITATGTSYFSSDIVNTACVIQLPKEENRSVLDVDCAKNEDFLKKEKNRPL